jgi:putative ABC transport system ATP-binding protein
VGMKRSDWFGKSEAPGREHTIRTVGVKRYYRRGEETVRALDGIDLTIDRGEFVSIMGPSGSGKSTLFNCMGALDQPTQGSVFVDEVDIAELDSEEMAWLRCRKIGYIFQNYNIVQVMTTVENVMLPMIFGGVEGDEALRRAVAILRRVGMGERLTHRAFELSGGQQQRVAIARAFANNPAIILADEPTANLDLRTGEEIIGLLVRLNKEDRVTVVCATHDFKILNASDRVVWMRDGKVERIQTRAELDIAEAELKS